jgi:two-component system sensor kinase FixL
MLLRRDAAGRHVKLNVAAPASMPPVLGDRVHLSQVLLNLIVNGMDAAIEGRNPKPSVTIEAKCKGSGMVEVAVTDTGNGIAPDLMDRVFDPFFTTKTQGMGIGLPVSRTIIEAHRGRIWGENGSGHGATFRFTLPVAEAAR